MSEPVTDWSLVVSIAFNSLSIPAAIYFAWQAHAYRKRISDQSKIADLADIESKLNRFARIEHASMAPTGTYRYEALINEGILTNQIIDTIISMSRKHGISGHQLENFKNIANSALSNRTWSSSSAVILINAAQELIVEVEKHITSA